MTLCVMTLRNFPPLIRPNEGPTNALYNALVDTHHTERTGRWLDAVEGDRVVEHDVSDGRPPLGHTHLQCPVLL